MRRQEVMDLIVAHENELRAMGVGSLALFGSVARNDATDTSDVDLLVEFDRAISLFQFFDVQMYLEKLLGADKVDLVIRRNVIEELSDAIYAEAVPCFIETGHSVSSIS